MRKWIYFQSNEEDSRERAVVEVLQREWDSVCVAVKTPGPMGFSLGSELTPAEAREMAAGLLELADVAERGIEHANDS